MPGPVTYDVGLQAYVQDGQIVGRGIGGPLPGATIQDPWAWAPYSGVTPTPQAIRPQNPPQEGGFPGIIPSTLSLITDPGQGPVGGLPAGVVGAAGA